MVLVWVSMPRRWNARSSSTEMLGSACGTMAGLASNRLTRVPRSARIEAIWHPVSAAPTTAAAAR